MLDINKGKVISSIARGWLDNNIPTQYAEGASWYEALLFIYGKIKECIGVVNDWQEWLVDFVETYKDQMNETIVKIVQEWVDDGTIEVIIADAIRWELDDYKEKTDEKFKGVVYLANYLQFDGTDETDKLIETFDLNGAAKYVLPANKSTLISKTVTVPEGSEIDGQGSTIIIREGIQALQLHSNTKVCGLKFQGTKTSVPVTGEWAIRAGGTVTPYGVDFAENITVCHCEGMDIGYGFIGLHYLDGFVVDSCTAYNTGYGNVTMASVKNGSVTNNKFELLRGLDNTESLAYHVQISHSPSISRALVPRSTNVIVNNNWLSGSPWEAIDTHGGGMLVITNNTVLNGRNGIALVDSRVKEDQPLSGPYNCVVSNNVIENMTDGAITYHSSGFMGARYGVISNNMIKECGKNRSATGGVITVSQGSGVNVIGNSINDCYGNAICFGGQSQDSIVDANIITNQKPSTLKTYPVAIAFQGTSSAHVAKIVNNNAQIRDGNDRTGSIFIEAYNTTGGGGYEILGNTHNYETEMSGATNKRKLINYINAPDKTIEKLKGSGTLMRDIQDDGTETRLIINSGRLTLVKLNPDGTGSNTKIAEL